MSAETIQPSEGSKDPVRIVYHSENRTFARLFNERSLDEVKDVVRRKLGLGKETGVSLKQMGRDALLDLEDDDDFQAFRVFVNSSVSVDIEITVGESQGPAVPPPPRARTSEGNETAITSVSPSREPATTSQRTPLLQSVEPHSPPAEASHKRKRKVSFDGASSTAVSHRTPKKRPAEPAAPSKTTMSAVKPPAKRQKKEVTKKKDPKQSEATESPQASSVSKPAVEKSLALEGRSEVATSTSKDAETAPSAKKKPKRSKKDTSSDPKSLAVETVAPGNLQSSLAIDKFSILDDVDADQINSMVNVPALQLATAKSGMSGVVGSTSKSRKSKAPLEGVCAAVPGTSESAVESGITAAILSKASEPPSEPPAKPPRVKKVTKKSATSSRASAKSAQVVHDPALEMILPPCPICRGVPFHIRYFCPVFLKGSDAIRARLEEIRGTDEGKKEWLINDLEGILRESEATSVSSLDAAPTNNVQTTEVSPPLPDVAPVPRTPNIPANSCLSEVMVESRNEGSSSESSDNMSDGGVEPKELPTSRKAQTIVEKFPPADDDLEAIIRGPTRKRQSILNVLDRIVGNKDEEEEDSDSKQDEPELEEDPDEEIGRSKHRLCKVVTHSSDSESEEEISGSSSPSRPSRGSSDNPGPAVQPSSEPLEVSTNIQDGDVVMKAPNVEEQDGDRDEETHAGSQMVVDEPSGEMGASTNKQPSPALRDSVSQPSDARSDEPQEPVRTEADPTFTGAGGVPGVAEDPTEMNADPIEPVDDPEHPVISRSSNVDPIEAPSEDSGASLSGVTQSTPKPGVTKRIKTRNGLVPDDEAEGPVLLEQLSTEVTEGMPTMGRTEGSEAPTSQEPATTRKSPRFSTLQSSTSTPAAVAWLKHKAKGARSIKAAKTPARRAGTRNDSSQSRGHLAQTPLVRWETLEEPLSSPSLLPDEPSLLVDELMSTPPPVNHPVRGRRQVKGKGGLTRKPTVTASSKPDSEANSNSHGEERLFDLSSSQIPFPYSQYQTPLPTGLPNGKGTVDATDSEEEEEPKVVKAKSRPTAPYRSLSQLASQATLFSPSLPTPATNKSMANGKVKGRVEASSSSSSSDTDEANGSEHIPRGRRAGSVFGTKKKRGILSRV